MNSEVKVGNIHVNGVKWTVMGDEVYTYNDVVEMAFPATPPKAPTVQYSRGHSDNPSGVLDQRLEPARVPSNAVVSVTGIM